MSDFLPQGYVTPKSSGRYTKIKDGDNFRLRILTNPIIYWEWWTEDKKPLRVEYTGSWVKTPEHATGKSKLVWAVVVWNYNTEQTEIWNIGQATVRDALEWYIRDEDFGDPKLYDVKISRKGSGMDDTVYTLAPLMKQENMKPIADKILKEAWEINLKALITNDNPFEVSDEAETPKNDSKVDISDVPF